MPTRPLLLLLGTGIGVAGLGLFLVLREPSTQRPAIPDRGWADPIEVASGAAYRGPWRMNESDWRFVDDPTVAIAENGVTGVAWTDHVEQDLFYRAYGPDGDPTGDPVNVSRNPETFSWLPRIVFPTGAPDRIYVLWQEIIFSGGSHGGETFFARSTDGGQSFSKPVNLSTSQAGDGKGRLTEQLWHNGSLDIAVGPTGNVYAAWTEYEGRLLLRRSEDDGQNFGPIVHVAGSDSLPARGPSLGIDSGGTVHLAWAVGNDPSADIHYAHSRSNELSFSRPRTVASSGGHADAPSLAVEPNGTVHLTYGESPTGPMRQYAVQYTRSQNGTDFATAVVLSRRHSDEYASAHFPTLAFESDGRLHALWELFPNPNGCPRALGYVRSTDAGKTFSSPIVVPGTDSTTGFNGSQQGLLMQKLAVNGAGQIAVVNSTFQRGTASHIWLYRGHPTR